MLGNRVMRGDLTTSIDGSKFLDVLKGFSFPGPQYIFQTGDRLVKGRFQA
jgi:hypothetical protein